MIGSIIEVDTTKDMTDGIIRVDHHSEIINETTIATENFPIKIIATDLIVIIVTSIEVRIRIIPQEDHIMIVIIVTGKIHEIIINVLIVWIVIIIQETKTINLEEAKMIVRLVGMVLTNAHEMIDVDSNKIIITSERVMIMSSRHAMISLRLIIQ